MNEFDESLKSPMQRRAFLARMSAAGLGAAAVAVLGGCGGGSNGGGPSPNPTPTPLPGGGGGTVFDPANFPGIIGRNINETVLNYALALEILEADLYRQALNAATGKALDAPLASSPSAYRLSVPAGALNPNSGNAAADAFEYLRDFTYVEAAHRDFLRVAIRSGGGTPQPPNPGGYKFRGGPGNDLKTILTNILTLEETGVRAYLGALPYLTSLSLAQTAGTIFSTEARHSAIINDAVGRDAGPMKMAGDQQVAPRYPSPNTFEYFLPPRTVLQRVPAFYDTDNNPST